MGLIMEAQKQAKRQALMDAAYALFLEQGTNKTSINDIVSRAKVAKGTFYLYFQDREDIAQALTKKISYQVLKDAYHQTRQHPADNIVDNIIYMLDCIVEYFKREPLVLHVVERKLSWALIEQDLLNADDPLIDQLMGYLRQAPALVGRDDTEIEHMLYMLLVLCGNVCYNSIIEKKPADIDTMKPMLYTMVRKVLQ